MLTKQLLLLAVDIPQTDIDQFPHINSRLPTHPAKDLLVLVLGQAS